MLPLVSHSDAWGWQMSAPKDFPSDASFPKLPLERYARSTDNVALQARLIVVRSPNENMRRTGKKTTSAQTDPWPILSANISNSFRRRSNEPAWNVAVAIEC